MENQTDKGFKYNYLGTDLKFPLNEKDKEEWAQVIYATDYANIPIITDKTIPEFCFRINLLGILDYVLTPEKMSKYKGLVTSADLLTRRRWVRKYFIETKDGSIYDETWKASCYNEMRKMVEDYEKNKPAENNSSASTKSKEDGKRKIPSRSSKKSKTASSKK